MLAADSRPHRWRSPMRVFLLTASALIAGSFADIALAQRAYAPLAQGQALLKQHCAACHEVGWGASPNKEAPPFREIVKRYPANALEEALAEGLPGHAPGVQYEFEPTEVDAIVRYLGSLGGKR
jgi:mono/diheme cytochrome c family protein